MSEIPQINTDEMDQRGAELVEVENRFLDGPYDQELFVQRIEQYKAVIGLNIYNMGRALLVMKAHCGHGNFMPLLERMEISQSAANKAMQVAAKFGTPKMQQLINGFSNQKGLGTKLVALALENDDDLEDLADGGTLAGMEYDDIDRMSASELRKALRQAKQSAEEDKEANDRLMAEKNAHADELAKKLAKAEGIPEKERWTEQVATYRKELTAFGLDAEELINTVNNIVLSLQDVDAPESAKQSMAVHTKDLVNTLISACGQLSNSVYDQLGLYINQPTYSISDELTLIDEDQEE